MSRKSKKTLNKKPFAHINPKRHKGMFILRDDGVEEVVDDFYEDLEEEEREHALAAANLGHNIWDKLHYFELDGDDEEQRSIVWASPPNKARDDVVYLIVLRICARLDDSRTSQQIVDDYLKSIGKI